MSDVWPYVAAIVPTIVVATLFYFLVKGMIEGDRRERLAQSRFEAAQDRERARDDAAAADSADRHEAPTSELANDERESGKSTTE